MTTAYRIRCYVGDPLLEALRVGRQVDIEVLRRAITYRESRSRHAETLTRGLRTATAQAFWGYIDEWSQEIEALKRACNRLSPSARHLSVPELPGVET